LCIQPLTGISLIDDLFDAISQARMSIVWGDY